MARLEVRQVRSGIGRKQNQRDTLRSLGLKRIGHVVVKQDRPEIRGMLATVPHLVAVETVPDETPHDEALHDEALHDEALHDEALHDEDGD